MLRSYGMVVGLMIMGAPLSMTACGNREGSEAKPEPVDNWAPLEDSGALVGTWSDGSVTLVIERGGRYRLQNQSGRWTTAGGRIDLNPDAEGNDRSYKITWSNRQNTLDIHDVTGKGYTLSRN